MSELTPNWDVRRRRSPFCVLLSLLILPFAAIAVAAVFPPSASGQYLFFFAALFRVVLFPLGVIALVLAFIGLFRVDTHPVYRAVLVSYIVLVVAAFLTMSGYRYGPGP